MQVSPIRAACFAPTLTARLHVIDATTTALRSLAACIARCDLDIAELVSAPMAAGLSTLVPTSASSASR